jgi:hypothetical protein
MLRALLGGFLLGPVLLLAAVLLLNKAALLSLVAVLMLVGLLVMAVLAGAVAGGTAKARREARSRDVVPAPAPHYPGKENLASRNKWRREFMAWHYTRPPTDD